MKAIKTKQMSQRTASEFYKIPRSTLKNKLAGLHPGDHEHSTSLTVQEEPIVNHVIKMSEYGFPVDSFELRCIVKADLERCGRAVAVFRSSMPGKEWAVALLKRQKALTTRLASNIQRKRAKVSKSVITEYISNLSKEVEEVPAENIWNITRQR